MFLIFRGPRKKVSKNLLYCFNAFTLRITMSLIFLLFLGWSQRHHPLRLQSTPRMPVHLLQEAKGEDLLRKLAKQKMIAGLFFFTSCCKTIMTRLPKSILCHFFVNMPSFILFFYYSPFSYRGIATHPSLTLTHSHIYLSEMCVL